MTSRWTCPRCDREFARPNTAHVCVPGGTVDDSFAGKPPEQRRIYDAVVEHLRDLGPLHEDAVRVGVFLKSDDKLAELRPKSRWLQLWLRLSRPISSPRVGRVVPTGADSYWHVVRLAAIDDVDEELRGWLTEAYLTATHGHGR